MNPDEPLENLIPAYVLGALDADERARVEAQLAADPAARQLLAEYEQVAGNLAFAAPALSAPEHLAADLQKRLSARRQAPGEALASRAAASQTAPMRMYRYLAVLAALLVVAVGITVAVQSGRSASPAALYTRLDTQEGAAHFQLQPGDVTDSVTGDLVAAADGRQAVIAVSALPELTPDQTFQLWVRSADGTVRSGGLFRTLDDTADPVTYITIPLRTDESVDMLAAVGVSLEPAGGSPYEDRPTGPRVFLIPINQEL